MALVDDDHPLAGIAVTGFRSEIITLRWSDVDRSGGWITLRREHSKNEDPRVLPLVGDIAALVERRWSARLVATKTVPRVVDLVFHRAGPAPSVSSRRPGGPP